METIGAPKGRPPTRSILKTRARRREPSWTEPSWTLSDFRQRPALDDMTGISRPSRPSERPIVAIHGTKLRKGLKAIDAHPAIVDRQRSHPDIPWTVR